MNMSSELAIRRPVAPGVFLGLGVLVGTIHLLAFEEMFLLHQELPHHAHANQTLVEPARHESFVRRERAADFGSCNIVGASDEA